MPDGSVVTLRAAPERYSFINASRSGEAHDTRTETEKDRGRVHYSTALRRLSGVSQVIPPDLSMSRRHTRASHSIKVALVAREIATDVVRRLDTHDIWRSVIQAHGGLDVAACEVAGLAHDLGHPPFGHAGEIALNQALRDHGVPDGFEGNAQTIRIVGRLESRRTDSVAFGLDLTKVSLAAIAKYPSPCPRDQLVGGPLAGDAYRRPPKFNFFVEDLNVYDALAPLYMDPLHRRQTLEASVMDLADDIAYAFHDLEDAYLEGFIDFALVVRDIADAYAELSKLPFDKWDAGSANAFRYTTVDLRRKHEGFFKKGPYLAAMSNVKSLFEDAHFTSRYDGSPEKSAEITDALSRQMGQIFGAVDLRSEPPWQDGPSLFVTSEQWHVLQVLKTVTRRYVIDSSRISMLEQSQSVIVAGLLERLIAWLRREPRVSALPEPLAGFLMMGDDGYQAFETVKTVGQRELRAVSDYVCTLSDEECLIRWHWLSGTQLPRYTSLV